MIKVYGFGNTENGELGFGAIEKEHILMPKKQRLPFDRRKYTLVQLSSGRNHTLFLLKSIQLGQNFVFSVGSNERLQLGRKGPWKRLEQVDGLNQHNIVKISCGFNNCLVLSDNGQLFSWGCNLFGQLGHGDKENNKIEKPSLIKSLATKVIVQISCGGNHCLALSKNGQIFSWGSNAFGQLGHGTSKNCIGTPMEITFLQWTPIKQIAAGGSHSAVLSYTGCLYLWGKNEFGQLGLSDSKDRHLPTLQRSLRAQKVAYISLGDEHSAAITYEGGLFTWGAGMYGQLGHGRKSNEMLPLKVFELMGSKLIQVSCGRCHTIAVSRGGRVFSFGLNCSGQLGVGSTVSKFLPVTVRGPWGEVETKEIILRGNERAVQLVEHTMDEEFGKTHLFPNEKSCMSVDSSNELDVKIDEVNELDEASSGGDQSFIIEEPDEDLQDEMSSDDWQEPKPKFICTEDHVFTMRNNLIEIDEYESDPDSDFEEGPVRCQYLVKEVVASRGDQSFIIIQSYDGKVTPKDYRKMEARDEIIKLDNSIFEKLSDIPKESIPLDIIEYLETVFSSFPAINASYLSLSDQHEGINRNKIRNFKIAEGINYEPLIDLNGGWINWRQAFHGFNAIEDAQNDRIDELITQALITLLSKMPDLSLETGTGKEKHSEILDDEVMRVYNIVPLFHMFHMVSDDNKFKLASVYAKSIWQLSESGINCLQLWWCKMSKRFFKNLVEIFKNCIRYIFLHKKHEVLSSVEHLKSCYACIKLLYKVNKHMEIISYKEFYLHGVSGFYNLKNDYIAWKQIPEKRDQFLCSFSFMLDPPAKNCILQLESAIQQDTAVRSTVRKQILTAMPFYGENTDIVVDPFFNLFLSRDNLLEKTINFLLLYDKENCTAEFKKPLRVIFEGEEAVDVGQGMKKEFFLLVMKEILDRKYGMFVEYEETRTIWFGCSMIEEDDVMYRVIGILCGLAIYNGVIIDLPFPLALYKKVLNENLELEDLAQLDPLLAKNLKDILETNYKEDEFNAIYGDMTFSISVAEFGTPVERELCPGGCSRILNFQNKEEYVDCYWKYILIESCAKQFDSFNKGFMKVLDKQLLQIFQAEELMQLVEGEELINWEDLESVTKYKEPFTKDHPTIRLFWRVFNSFTIEEKKKFLKFLTGSDRIPVTGIKGLNLVIQAMYVDEEFLPVAHTCFNILDLPLEYHSNKREELMHRKLMQAAELAVEFALA